LRAGKLLFASSLMSVSRKYRTDFNDLLVESVEESITEVLGFKVTSAFWYHYQAYLGITKEEMPYRLDTLFSSLKDAFGVGGETLGRHIIRKLYAKTDVPLEYVPGHPLSEYVEELKEFLAEDLMVHEPEEEKTRNDKPKSNKPNDQP